MPFIRVSFSPIFPRIGYQKKANFLAQVVKTCQRGNYVTMGDYLLKFLCFEYTFYQLFLEQGII